MAIASVMEAVLVLFDLDAVRIKDKRPGQGRMSLAKISRALCLRLEMAVRAVY